MIGTWGQDNKGRSLTINDEIAFFRFELSKKNRLLITNDEIVFFFNWEIKSIK